MHNNVIPNDSSDNATSINSIENAKEEFLKHIGEQRSFLDVEINQAISAATTILSDLNGIKELSKTSAEELIAINTNLEETKDSVESSKSLLTKAEELHTRIESFYKGSSTRRNNIEALYLEIEGQEVDDEEAGEGKKKRIPGLKDKLGNSYKQLELQIKTLSTQVDTEHKRTEESLIDLVVNEEAKLSEFQVKWETNLSLLQLEIKKLLPDALTAGLSHAYESRRKEEETNAVNHKASFHKALTVMSFLAIIPVAISVIQYVFLGKSLDDLIKTIPNLVAAIVPIYAPTLWVAYFSNKQINLSKRLIEEYAHKESVAKTFEGLSRQIEAIEDREIANDLRNKLLYNLLEISSENPGKLITDYNKSDHPLMDALDKSVKLTNAVQKLARIPGFNKLANKLSDKSESILDEQRNKAEAGLNAELNAK